MYFIQLNQLLLADRQLSIFDKVVYAALCTLTQFNDPITGQKNQLISQNDLYNFLQSSISIGTIKRSLDKLRSLKYINVKETKYKNRITVIQTYTQSDPSLQTAKTTEIQNLDQSEPNSRSEVSAERSNNEYTEIQNLDHSDPPINSNSNNKKGKEEERTPNQSFSYSTQYQNENRKESSDKFYKDAFQKYPRELVRAHEVSQCIDEMCECYELNAKEFERSKSNFKQTVRNRAEKIVKVLLDDKSDFAPMEVFWGIKLYETSSTSEPTPAGIKKSCIKCRIERNNYTDKLKYVLNLRSDDLNVPEDDFLLTSFVNRFGSELEGLENARYSESKDYDVKFNDLVLKMAELPVQDNIPDYWDMYRNQSSALPINLDIRQIA
ncbi:MAG: hypothetical protein K5752_04465 [Succinivibrionaceae bacterium]|nr:hypothetical protein [Succinivibrionaceae bacterium]